MTSPVACSMSPNDHGQTAAGPTAYLLSTRPVKENSMIPFADLDAGKPEGKCSSSASGVNGFTGLPLGKSSTQIYAPDQDDNKQDTRPVFEFVIEPKDKSEFRPS